jgi:hypothetical protein
MIRVELIDGFGIAITWHKCLEHDFAIIFLCFAIKFKHCG